MSGGESYGPVGFKAESGTITEGGCTSAPPTMEPTPTLAPTWTFSPTMDLPRANNFSAMSSLFGRSDELVEVTVVEDVVFAAEIAFSGRSENGTVNRTVYGANPSQRRILSGGGATRLFNVANRGVLKLEDLHLKDGLAYQGGCIYAEYTAQVH